MVVAFVVVHVNMAWFPIVIDAGEAESVAVVTAGGNEGSMPTPRQPDMRPAQTHTATTDKHFAGKCTLHRPWGGCRGFETKISGTGNPKVRRFTRRQQLPLLMYVLIRSLDALSADELVLRVVSRLPVLCTSGSPV